MFYCFQDPLEYSTLLKIKSKQYQTYKCNYLDKKNAKKNRLYLFEAQNHFFQSFKCARK
jgi:hypothetical protein